MEEPQGNEQRHQISARPSFISKFTRGFAHNVRLKGGLSVQSPGESHILWSEMEHSRQQRIESCGGVMVASISESQGRTVGVQIVLLKALRAD